MDIRLILAELQTKNLQTFWGKVHCQSVCHLPTTALYNLPDSLKVIRLQFHSIERRKSGKTTKYKIERQREKRERERKIETISNNKQKNSPKKRNR